MGSKSGTRRYEERPVVVQISSWDKSTDVCAPDYWVSKYRVQDRKRVPNKGIETDGWPVKVNFQKGSGVWVGCQRLTRVVEGMFWSRKRIKEQKRYHGYRVPVRVSFETSVEITKKTQIWTNGVSEKVTRTISSSRWLKKGVRREWRNSKKGERLNPRVVESVSSKSRGRTDLTDWGRRAGG